MKLRLFVATAVIALPCVPSLAVADDDGQGWYLRGNVGYGAHTDINITDAVTESVDGEGHGTFALGLGYDFGNNWRLEADGASLKTDLSQISSTAANLRTSSYMLNAIYDFKNFGDWVPYAGAGLGFVDNDVNIETSDFLLNDNANGFGWQLLTGLGYDITYNLTWETHYRYLDVGSIDLTSSAGNTTLEDVGSHTLLTGFRYKFGAPPPPPPVSNRWPVRRPVASSQTGNRWSTLRPVAPQPVAPQPVAPRPVAPQPVTQAPEPVTQAPARPTIACWDGTLVFNAANCPAELRGFRTGETVRSLCGQSYRQDVIYYDFDMDVSNETGTKLKRILDINDHCNVSGMNVVGHADTYGSRAYNQTLSERRAADVVDKLTTQGVEPSLLSSSGAGETDPVVNTGDGVKEQLNRRTEILVNLGSLGAIR